MGAALLAGYEDLLSRGSLWSTSRLNAAARDELSDIFIAPCKWTRVYFELKLPCLRCLDPASFIEEITP